MTRTRKLTCYTSIVLMFVICRSFYAASSSQLCMSEGASSGQLCMTAIFARQKMFTLMLLFFYCEPSTSICRCKHFEIHGMNELFVDHWKIADRTYSLIHGNSVDGFFGSEARLRLYQRRVLRLRRHFQRFSRFTFFPLHHSRFRWFFKTFAPKDEKTVDRFTVNLRVLIK